MADSKDKDSLPASNTPLFAASEKIQKINVADEIKNSFLDYSMSVIISRALPDARDGLKPSQRRILLAMHDLNLGPGRHYRKCAKICGDKSSNWIKIRMMQLRCQKRKQRKMLSCSWRKV